MASRDDDDRRTRSRSRTAAARTPHAARAMGSTGLSRVLRAGLERLAERRADAPESCEATAAVFARVPASARVRGGPRWRVKRAAGEDALLAAAGAALLDPALAVVAGGCLRPVATHALTHALDAALAAAAAEEDSAADDEARARDAARRRASAGASSARSPAKSSHDAGPAGAVHSAGSEGRPTAHERICAALGSLVELLPHVAPIAARYLRASPPPFARLVATSRGGGDGGGGTTRGGSAPGASSGVSDTRARDVLVARATVRLLRAFGHDRAVASARASDARDDAPGALPPGAAARDAPSSSAAAGSPLRRWDCAPLARVAVSPAVHAEARWTIAMALEHAMGVSRATCASLRQRQAPDAETRHAFAEAWDEADAEIQLEKAAAYLDPEGVGGERRATTNDAPMREEEEDDDDDDDEYEEHSERSEHPDGSIARKASSLWLDRPLPGETLPAAPGHARVGGVELRARGFATSPRDEATLLRTLDDPSRKSARSSTRGQRSFVQVPSARRNLRALALALCQGRPVLLEGPAGCGKSAALEAAAEATGNADFVTLHLDAQTDSKSLLGAYVVGAAPGEFRWRPGALTRAVEAGRWVVIEDVDQAPHEVLAALAPLLEERRLYVPGRGESIDAADGFQLVGTCTTGGGRSAGGAAAAGARADPLASLWARVAVEPPSGDEPAEILLDAHPSLAPLAPAMLATVERAQRACGRGGADEGGLRWGGGGRWGVLEEEEAGGGDEGMDVDGASTTPSAKKKNAEREDAEDRSSSRDGARVSAGRAFTLRDLLRWARRLETLRAPELSLLRGAGGGKPARPDALPPKLRAAAYEEAADVLAGGLPSGPGRLAVLEAMAQCWGVSRDEVAHGEATRKPAMRRGNGAVAVGRATLPSDASSSEKSGGGGKSWSQTGHAMRLLERVAKATQMTEPALLVGETGTGKTALVQRLADVAGAPLTVVNLSNQSESADFLGGFRPAGARHLCLPLLPRFRAAFDATFDAGANAAFVDRVARYAERRKWAHLLHAFRAGVKKVAELLAREEDEREKEKGGASEEEGEDEGEGEEEGEGAREKKKKAGRGAKRGAASKPEPAPPAKKGRRRDTGVGEKGERARGSRKRAAADSADEKASPLPPALVAEWRAFERDLSAAERAVGSSGSGGGPIFAFVEGALVTALKEGRWILLDEINLAPAETLERLTGILESPTGSVVLSERGDGAAVTRHPRFRVFGAMNPATDVGKRDLPAALKHRFTEVYAGECESREDLSLIVKAGLGTVPNAPIVAVVDFYLAARRAARETLLDSADQKPRYSLRTLSRAMEYARSAAPMYGARRALYDGFAMAFKTLLKNESGEALEKLIVKHLLKGQAPKVRRSFGRSRTRGFVFSPRAPGVFFLTRVSLGSGSTPPARGAVTRRLVAVLIGVVDSIVGAHTYSPRDRASLKSARGP